MNEQSTFEHACKEIIDLKNTDTEQTKWILNKNDRWERTSEPNVSLETAKQQSEPIGKETNKLNQDASKDSSAEPKDTTVAAAYESKENKKEQVHKGDIKMEAFYVTTKCTILKHHTQQKRTNETNLIKIYPKHLLQNFARTQINNNHINKNKYQQFIKDIY